jgi:integrase
MATLNRSPRGQLRGQPVSAHSLDDVVQETFRLWRKHHLTYDQTKYVVERVRRRLALEPPHTRHRTVARLELSEVERLIQATYRFESNRHTRYSIRTVQAIVMACGRAAGIQKRVYPHLLRHSIATILLDSGLVPIDQVQKFLGHQYLSTTQMYAETSLQALSDNYIRALGGKR